MNIEKQYVYVTWDSLSEKVICVHSKEDSECEKCKSIRESRSISSDLDKYYFLEQDKFEILD